MTCYLKRDVEPQAQANVILHINGKGKAGLDANGTQNPVVLKGFQVDSFQPFKVYSHCTCTYILIRLHNLKLFSLFVIIIIKEINFSKNKTYNISIMSGEYFLGELLVNEK